MCFSRHSTAPALLSSCLIPLFFSTIIWSYMLIRQRVEGGGRTCRIYGLTMYAERLVLVSFYIYVHPAHRMVYLGPVAGLANT